MATKDKLTDALGDEMGAADDLLASLPSFDVPEVERAAKPAPSVADKGPSDDQLAALRAVVEEVGAQPAPAVVSKAEPAPKQAAAQPAAAMPQAVAPQTAAATVNAPTRAAVAAPLKSYLEKTQEPSANIDAMVLEASRSVTSGRVVVGKLLEQGIAPFEHDKNNRESPFVVIEGADGDVTLWGVDLPRALQEAGVREGMGVVLENPGRRPVTVVVEDKDPAGKVIGSHEEVVERNEWRATTLDKLRATAALTAVAVAPAAVHAAAAAPTAAPPVAAPQAPTRVASAAPVAPAIPARGPSAGSATPQDPMLAALRSVVEDVMTKSTAPRGRYSAEDLARVAGRLSNLKAAITPEELQPIADGLPALRHPVRGGGAAAPGPTPSVGSVAATPGEAAQMRGTSLLGEGVRALAGGSASLVGAALKGLGRATHAVADLASGPDKTGGAQAQVEPKFDRAASASALADIQALMEEFGLTPDDVVEPGQTLSGSSKLSREPEAQPEPTREAPAPLPAVLPRLSEYRISQVEKAAEIFGQEQDAFWASSTKLTALKAEMERLSRERGLSIADVSEKMKPGGDFAELREKFNEAVSENPDASARKRAMDKALDSFVRQFGRAQEEVLNPEQEGNPHYESLKKRLDRSHAAMEGKTAGVPAFARAGGGLEESHFEKLREAVKQIMERVKAVVKEFMAMLKGNKSESANEVEPS